MDISTKFYDNALVYVLNRIRKLNIRHIDKYDILHTALIEPQFTKDNWKNVIDAVIHNMLNSSVFMPLGRTLVNSPKVNLRYCKKCDESYPEDYFKSGFNYKRGTIQYRTICKKCFNKIRMMDADYKKEQSKRINIWNKKNRATIKDYTSKERHKRFREKQTKELGDWYIKRLLLRYGKYERNEITPELLIKKRNAITILRKKIRHI